MYCGIAIAVPLRLLLVLLEGLTEAGELSATSRIFACKHGGQADDGLLLPLAHARLCLRGYAQINEHKVLLLFLM